MDLLNVFHTTINGLIILSYLFVVLIIIRSKATVFKNGFFSIFVATGIADIASLFTNCTLRLIRELKLGEETKEIALISSIITYMALIAHLIGNMLITINRYSALCLMNKYDAIWTRRNVLIAVIVQYAVSFVLFAHVIRANVEYIHNADGTVIIKSFREKQIDLIARFTCFGACIIYAAVSLSLNTRLLIEWKRLSKTNGVPLHGHQDKGLLLYTLLVFVCTMLVCSQQIVRTISILTENTTLNLWIALQYVWMNELMVNVAPFSLMVLSSDFRQEVFNLFRCSKHRSSTSLFVAVPSTRRSAVKRF
uniref:G protein-coupled receptor n=1 Tax=Haemonchus contortus TaxID=6289 RepID=A0A7I4YQL6_HAECO